MTNQGDKYLGTEINGYLLVKFITSGDFGRIYQAQHTETSDSVAIKLLPREKLLEARSELFCLEEHLLKGLSHLHLMPILDTRLCRLPNDDRCLPYIMTPYASGGSLRERIRQHYGKPFSLDEALSILRPVGEALQYLHQQNIVHRGVQPESILYEEQNHPLLGGLDLAIIDSNCSLWKLGTKYYRAPEQFDGAANQQSDQFALACIAYELLIGQHPFFPRLTQEPLKATLSGKIDPISLGLSIPEHVEKALAKALSFAPENRYSTIIDFVTALSPSKKQVRRLPDMNLFQSASREGAMRKNFFISYSSVDQQWAEWVAWQLETAGYTTTLQTWDFHAGNNLILAIDKALRQAERVLALLSPDYIASSVSSTEWANAFLRDPRGEDSLLVPVLIHPCTIEGLLSQLIYIDLTDLDEQKARTTLLERIQQSRHKPESAPRYPTISTPASKRHPFPNATPKETFSISGFEQDKNEQYKQRRLLRSIQSTPLELKIPEMGEHFLNRNRHDREYLINIIDTIISSISTIDGVKNLLRGKLSDPQINRINFRDGSRNIAESIIGILESRGALNPPHQHYHALGAFLNDLIEDDSVGIGYDAAVKIVALLFRYTLIRDRKQIIKLSTQFQVPSPLLTDETLTTHPPSPASLPSTIKITDLQERFESLYNRRRYLLDVKFLSQGAKAASSVCRIDFDKRGEGTGFLVAPDLILTNYHVMMPQGYKGDLNTRARRCEIKFGIIEGMSAGSCFKLHDKEWLVAQSKPEELDFMLLRLNRSVTENNQISPLHLESNSVQLDEFVNIIQHPNGGSMEVSIRFNQVVAVEDNRIYYLADTEEGSSGSPVFDDMWRLVALHHSGGKLDKAGNLIVAANIGVPINAIREQIAVYLNN
jgi:serine/threonine protein kinase/V8-like Glu-specific endopeptidase